MKFLSDILAKAGLTVDGVVTLNNTATGQTPAANDNSTKLATTAWVRGFVTPYTLPIASGTTLGGIKIGSGLSIDGTGIVSVAASGVGAIRALQQITATAGQTVFTVSGGYTPGLIDVFLNGVLVTPNAIDISNGNTFILADATVAGDLLDIFVYNPIYNGFISSTDQVPEGSTNLYYTNTRARAAITLTTTGVNGASTYNSTTGVLNIPNYQSTPPGGNAGDILAKNSATDYDVVWIPNYTSQVQHIVKAGVALTKGQAVYVSSADGTNMIVSKASNASETTSSKTLGLVAQTLALNGQGFVVTEGLLAGLDTSSAQVGDPVWLGTNGNLIFGLTNKPVAPAHLVFIGVVTRVQQNNGEIFVKVQNGFELDELHNLSVANASDGDMIKYVASTGLWTKTAATTTNITEGTNLYYTDARVNTYLTSNSYATQSYVSTQIANLVASAPATLDTLNELAASLGNDPNFATTISTSIGTKVPQSRTITINGTTYDLSADRSWSIAAGVTSFNTRTGAITLSSSDVTTALGYTPANPTSYVPYTGATGAVNLGNYDLTVNGITIGRGAGGQNSNTAIGNSALSSTSGVSNTAVGTNALLTATSYNTAVGHNALLNKFTGTRNVAIGYRAGFTDQSGTGNIFIGAEADVADYNVYSNCIVIGNSAVASQTNSTVIGNSSTVLSTIYGALKQTSVTTAMLKADSAGKLVAAIAGTDYVAPSSLSGYVPTTRTLTINGTTYDLSADRSWTIASGVTSFNTRTGDIIPATGDYTTAQVTESGNLYFTNTRARSAISLTTTGTSGAATYDNTTGILNIPQYQGGVTSFNTRTGAITLTSTDVTTALGFTPASSVSSSSRTIQTYTATANQTTFTVTGGYVVGLVDVYINGIKISTSDFTATNGSTVVLATGTGVGNIVEVVRYNTAFTATNALRQITYFTATAGQTTFTVTYNPGLVDVFYNGSKLAASDYTATNGTSVVLGFSATLNDTIEVVAYSYAVGAYTGQAQLNGTGFVKVNGTTVSYDNSTYLPLSGGTLIGSLIGTTATFNTSLEAVTVYVGSSTTTGFSGAKLFMKSANNLDYNGAVFQSSTNSNSITIAHTGTIARIASTYGSGGTGTFTDLAFATGGIDRFTITSTGVSVFSSTIIANDVLLLGTTSTTTGSKVYVYGSTNQTIRVESTIDQAGLRLIAGSGTTNRAARVDFLNGVTSLTTPQWTIINDYSQNGTNDLSIVNSNPANRILIINQSGFIGIGTNSNPDINLQLGRVFGFNYDINSGYIDCNRTSTGNYIVSQFATRIHLDSALGEIKFLTAPSGTSGTSATFVERLKITANASIFTTSITASSIIKSGGTSTQFLKADGSVDSTTYASGNFYVIDYLVVAGGGGGGGAEMSNGYGGGGSGGGAGGYLASTTGITVGSSYTVIVGAGGAGGASRLAADGSGLPGSNGGYSQLFHTVTLGGGQGMGDETGNGNTTASTGGSGGGTGGDNSASPGLGTPGQGNSGGSRGSTRSGGGGGGANTAGGTSLDGSRGGLGGNGLTWFDGNVYACGAGGGGGGAVVDNAAGGNSSINGGRGSRSTGGGGTSGEAGGQATPGNANTGTGGGGAGAGYLQGGQNGGSGIVIIRYAGSQRGTGGTVTSSGGYTYHRFTSSGTFTA